MSRFLSLIISLSSFILCQAQHETDNWVLGKGRHLRFYNDSIAILNDSKIHITGSSVSYSDTLGNLLFYSNGVQIWNKNHQTMKNGDDLMGDSQNTNIGIVVKQPGHNLYYLFTSDWAVNYYNNKKNRGIRYSIIDMGAENNLGEVIEKNVLISDTDGYITNKICAIKHYNGKDIWIIYQQNDSIVVNLLCENGLKRFQRIYRNGKPFLNYIQMVGTMSVNTKGNLLFISDIKTSPNQTESEVYNFDNKNGTLTLRNVLTENSTAPILTSSFSIKSDFFYYSAGYNNFKQYNLNLPVTSQIISSRKEYSTSTLVNNLCDFVPIFNKTICFQTSDAIRQFDVLENKLSTFKKPDTTLLLSNVEFRKYPFYQSLYDTFLLGEDQPRWGLPHFPHYYYQLLNFSFEQTYQNLPCVFRAYSCLDSTTFDWDFGDTSSHALNTVSMKYPTHVYKDTGVYTVRCIIHRSNMSDDTIIKTIHIEYNPIPLLGKDTTFCEGQSIILTTPYTYDKYLWSNGDTTNSISVNSSGTYILKTYKLYPGTCNGIEVAINSDSINIIVLPYPKKISQRKYYKCANKQVIITAENTGMKYLWSTGDSTKNITTSIPGKYVVKISNQQCFIYDTVEIINFNTIKPVISIQNNQLISTKAQTYKWYNNDSALYNESRQTLLPKRNGYYQVLIKDSNDCEIISDSVYFEKVYKEIKIYPNPSSELFIVELPNNDTYTFNLFDITGRELELKYSIKDTITILDFGNYASSTYIFKITNNSGMVWVYKLIKK